MGIVLLDRNALLKDMQGARKVASGRVGESDRSQNEDIYWTGYANAIEDIVAAISSGVHDVEVNDE